MERKSFPKLYKAIIVVTIVLCFGLSAQCANSLNDGDNVNQAGVMNKQGVVLRAEGKLQEARALLDKACLLDPNRFSASVHVNLGLTLQDLGDLKAAKDQLIIALRFDPNLPQTLFNLARCYQAMGDTEHAIASWKDFLDKNPSGSHSDIARQTLLALEGNEMANQTKALTERSQGQESRAQLEKECRAQIEKVSLADPNSDSGAAHLNLGITLQALGHLEEARDQYLTSLRYDSNRPQTLYQLGNCYSLLGDIDHATAYWKEFLSKEPNGGMYSDTARRMLLSLKRTPRMPDAPNASDYFSGAVVTFNKISRWSIERQPIKVFIESGEGVNGYQPCYRQALMTAFDKWITALNHCLFCRLVADRQSADVICRWTTDRSTFQFPAEAEQGETVMRYLPDPVHKDISFMDRCEVVFCIIDLDHKVPISCDRMLSLCLHEVGHVLGIQGHSANINDIMFYRDADNPPTELSERDKATMRRLYSAYPSADN